MHETDQTASSRPTSRWSSSRFTITTTESNNLAMPLVAARKKMLRPTKTSQQTFAHMTKTKHDMEEIFKFCYSTNSKLDQFKETVTGSRIDNSPRVPSPPPAHTPFTEASVDVFKVRHCVSREDIRLSDRRGNEYQSVFDQLNKIPRHRPVSLDNDHRPMIIQPIKLRPSLTSKSPSFIRPDESPLVKLAAYSQSIAAPSSEPTNIKRSATATFARNRKSSALSTSIPAMVYSLASDRRDQINRSPSSASTSNSSQEQHQPHVLTGTAITTHQRLRTRTAHYNPRAKPKSSQPPHFSSEQPIVKTSPFLFDSDVPEAPAHIVTQPVASIPSKSSRYVLVTFPKTRSRYHIPTSVERLLLPERFPILFQNILHSSEQTSNQK